MATQNAPAPRGQDDRSVRDMDAVLRAKLRTMLNATQDAPGWQDYIESMLADLDVYRASYEDALEKMGDALERAAIDRSRLYQAEAENMRLRNQAVKIGMEIIGVNLARELDMTPEKAEKIFRMLIGENPAGTVDEIPPQQREYLRELLLDIQRQVLDE